MQRYDLVAVTYQVYYTDHEMEEYDEGEWVKHDDAAARIAELEAECDRLAAIVEQIPTTKDGVRVGIADRVFSYEPSAGDVVARVPIGKGGSFTTCLAEIASLSQSWGVPSYREVSECYSTRAAAEAAAKETK